MPKIELIIGDQNLSSWSLRAWLAVKASGLEFSQRKILLDRSDTKRKIRKFSPSGRVPALIVDYGKKHIVWDSLAIAEFVAELSKNENELWPFEPMQRAYARSMVAEMHSGFQALRTHLPMNIQLKTQVTHLDAETLTNISRIQSIWKGALKRSRGPFLFGKFGIADAFYAPVVFRFQSYGIQISDRKLQAYMKAILNHLYVKEWVRGARQERPLIPRF